MAEEHPETQAPCRTRQRSGDRPAQGGERRLSRYSVALLEIRPRKVVRRESTKAGEPKPGKDTASSPTFSQLLLLEGQAGSWRGDTAPFPGGSALPASISGFPHPSPPLAPSQHPSSSLGEVGEGHKTHPLGTYGAGAGLGTHSWVQPAPALLISSPSWWVVKLLSQLFPVKSPHQEACHLGSLKKKYFSAGNCFLNTARPPRRSCRGTDVCAGRAAEDAKTVEPEKRWRCERIKGEVLR